MNNIGICGLGVVGSAVVNSLLKHNFILNNTLFIYDKYKDDKYKNFDVINNTDVVFLTLPTPFSRDKKCYDIDSIRETLDKLKTIKYNGLIVIKSTLEPLITDNLAREFNLDIVHNPEFLSAKTAHEDYHNQKHIVIGKSVVCNEIKLKHLIDFYKKYYPDALISICSASESESMKIFSNSFYATKIQFFTEMFMLTQKINVNYKTITDLMIKNGWINPMHTQVPGTDGKVSFGGMCFPKDTTALLKFMEKNESPSKVLNAVVEERNLMRSD